jgi:hypothetical protein
MRVAGGHMADRFRAGPAVRGTAGCRVRWRVLGVEGVVDLAVGDVVLAVDAVGEVESRTVTLRPAGAAIWAGGAPAFSQRDSAACRRLYGRRARPVAGSMARVRACCQVRP